MALCSTTAAARKGNTPMRKVLLAVVYFAFFQPVPTLGFVGQDYQRNGISRLAFSFRAHSGRYHLEDDDQPEANIKRAAQVAEGISILDPTSLLPVAAVFASTVLLLLAASPAFAIDHPIDQTILGVPIPVPDIRYFIAGGLCAAASHGITTPIDVVKTRMQAEPLKFSGLGVTDAATVILEESGYSVFLGGLAPTVIGYGIEGAAKFGLYESLKPTFASVLQSETTAVPYLLAAVSAGAVASLMLCPLERLRIRAVTDPTFPSNVYLGLSRLVEEEGPLSPFGGMGAMLSKQVPYTMGKQISFDVFSRMFYQAAAKLSVVNVGAEISVFAAFCASIMACVTSHPGDVILTDTYKSVEEGQLPKFTDVVADIYDLEGLNGFLAGISARFLHVGAIITSQLVLYDVIKQLLGLPATGS